MDPDAPEESAVERVARVALTLIERKLKGVHAAYIKSESARDSLPTKEISVANQVEALIQVRPAQTTSPRQLAADHQLLSHRKRRVLSTSVGCMWGELDCSVSRAVRDCADSSASPSAGLRISEGVSFLRS